MAVGIQCWRCEEPGHGYTDCRRPPARTRKELDDRISRLLERWDAGYGEISTRLKTQFVTAEIKSFEKARKAA
jgi:hypothetical protein